LFAPFAFYRQKRKAPIDGAITVLKVDPSGAKALYSFNSICAGDKSPAYRPEKLFLNQ
jgi:hypothetical protein